MEFKDISAGRVFPIRGVEGRPSLSFQSWGGSCELAVGVSVWSMQGKLTPGLFFLWTGLGKRHRWGGRGVEFCASF